MTLDEVAAYLNEAAELKLTAEDIAALAECTEGWVAALQLAALSMQGRDDVAGVIAGFAGNDRYFVDYLVEEVLQCQPAHVRSFIPHTGSRPDWIAEEEQACSWPPCSNIGGEADGAADSIDLESMGFVGDECLGGDLKAPR